MFRMHLGLFSTKSCTVKRHCVERTPAAVISKWGVGWGRPQLGEASLQEGCLLRALSAGGPSSSHPSTCRESSSHPSTCRDGAVPWLIISLPGAWGGELAANWSLPNNPQIKAGRITLKREEVKPKVNTSALPKSGFASE